MNRRIGVLFLLLLAAVSAGAHDFWVWPETFRPAPGRRVVLRAGVGEIFPKFTNPMPLERIEGLRLLGPSGEQALSSWEAPIGADAGGYVLALTVKARFIELKPADFLRYITEEEFTHVVKARREGRQEDRPGREIYSRYSKLLLQAGDGPDGAVLKPLGQELEIVPEKNPARLSPGESLPVRVLFRGQPLVDARVAAAPAVADGEAKGGHNFPVVARTDRHGRAALRLDRPGAWYARLIHMIPHTGADAEWRSFFATLTFSVGK